MRSDRVWTMVFILLVLVAVIAMAGYVIVTNASAREDRARETVDCVMDGGTWDECRG